MSDFVDPQVCAPDYAPSMPDDNSNPAFDCNKKDVATNSGKTVAHLYHLSRRPMQREQAGTFKPLFDDTDQGSDEEMVDDFDNGKKNTSAFKFVKPVPIYPVRNAGHPGQPKDDANYNWHPCDVNQCAGLDNIDPVKIFGKDMACEVKTYTFNTKFLPIRTIPEGELSPIWKFNWLDRLTPLNNIHSFTKDELIWVNTAYIAGDEQLMKINSQEDLNIHYAQLMHDALYKTRNEQWFIPYEENTFGGPYAWIAQKFRPTMDFASAWKLHKEIIQAQHIAKKEWDLLREHGEVFDLYSPEAVMKYLSKTLPDMGSPLYSGLDPAFVTDVYFAREAWLKGYNPSVSFNLTRNTFH